MWTTRTRHLSRSTTPTRPTSPTWVLATNTRFFYSVPKSSEVNPTDMLYVFSIEYMNEISRNRWTKRFEIPYVARKPRIGTKPFETLFICSIAPKYARLNFIYQCRKLLINEKAILRFWEKRCQLFSTGGRRSLEGTENYGVMAVRPYAGRKCGRYKCGLPLLFKNFIMTASQELTFLE